MSKKTVYNSTTTEASEKNNKDLESLEFEKKWMHV
jgi:hypothetical protein